MESSPKTCIHATAPGRRHPWMQTSRSDWGWLLVGTATKPRAGNPFPALDSGLRNPAQKPAFLLAISKIQGVVKV